MVASETTIPGLTKFADQAKRLVRVDTGLAGFRTAKRCDRLARMSTSAQASVNQIRAAMEATNDLFNSEVFGKRNFDALNKNLYCERPHSSARCTNDFRAAGH